MKTFYPGYRLEKLFVNDRFYIVQVTGDETTAFPVFGFDRGDGYAALDAISVSDKPCHLVTARFNKKIEPWTDGGAVQVGAVAAAFIWDEPFRYWCVADVARPNNKYKYDGCGFPLAKGERKQVSGKGIDYFAVVAGHLRINGKDCRVGEVIPADSDQLYAFDALVDSAVLKIIETENRGVI